MNAVESTYAYRARDATGAIATGTMMAASADEVLARGGAEGKIVLNIEDNPHRPLTELDTDQIRLNEAAKRVRREDVIAFCQQLSVMLETGVPLTESLDAFCRQVRSEFRLVLGILQQDVCSGEPFSSAMAKWPRVFPSMIISLMKAAEVSGQLAMMLGRVGDYLAKERRTLKQVRGALTYPSFMIGTSFLMTVFLVVFILPRFAGIYEQRSAALPAPTKVLMAISNFIINEWMVYGPALAGAAISLLVWRAMPSGRKAFDWMRLNVPLLSSMYRRLYITRSARTMSTLLAAGVNLLDIISICRGVTNNVHYDRLWDEMERGVRDGRQMSDAVFESPYVPANIASMIASGERSGRLESVMSRIAEFSEEELDTAIKQVTAYIEPLMIIIMGVIIGGVALALLLPIFTMGRVMSGG